MTAKNKKRIGVLTILTIILLTFMIWTAWGNTALELNTYTITSEMLPDVFNGYRIAHVSDLHNAEMGKDNGKLSVVSSVEGVRALCHPEHLRSALDIVCGAITYKATDTLTNPDESMCRECQGVYAAENARKSAGFIGGTQVTKIIDMKPTAANTTGVRGVQFDKKSGRYRARLKFKGKLLNFGSYKTIEEAAMARKKAEIEFFGTFLEELKGME